MGHGDERRGGHGLPLFSRVIFFFLKKTNRINKQNNNYNCTLVPVYVVVGGFQHIHTVEVE